MAMLGVKKSKILKNRNGNTSLNTNSGNIDTSSLAETSLYCRSNQNNSEDTNNNDSNT